MHKAFIYDRKNHTQVTRTPCKNHSSVSFSNIPYSKQAYFLAMFLSKFVRTIKQNKNKVVHV